VLQPVVKGAAPGAEDEPPSSEAAKKTANSARLSRLQQLVEDALRTANIGGNPNHGEHGRFASAPDDAGGSGASEPQGARYPNPLTQEEREELERQDNAAMDTVIAENRDVMNAMTRPDAGSIAFLVGDAGGGPPKHKGAHGIAGIIAKHGEESARRMPRVIAHGELGPVYEQGGKRNIYHEDDTAVLALVRKGDKLTWLLNGFRPESEEKEK
jgi:hypothetical protein